MSELSRAIREYNDLAQEWNENYGHLTKAITVEEDEFSSDYTQRALKIFKSEMTERKKISITVTTIGDFKKVSNTVESDGLSRGELAHILVRAGERVLELS